MPCCMPIPICIAPMPAAMPMAMCALASSEEKLQSEELLLEPGNLDLLLSFAREGSPAPVLSVAVQVGCACTANGRCVGALGEGDSFVYLSPLLRLEPLLLEPLLKLLTSLATQPQVVARFVSR